MSSICRMGLTATPAAVPNGADEGGSPVILTKEMQCDAAVTFCRETKSGARRCVTLNSKKWPDVNRGRYICTHMQQHA